MSHIALHTAPAPRALSSDAAATDFVAWLNSTSSHPRIPDKEDFSRLGMPYSTLWFEANCALDFP
jgi:hypothetical protein